MKCRECGADDWSPHGHYQTTDGERVRRWRCGECGRTQSERSTRPSFRLKRGGEPVGGLWGEMSRYRYFFRQVMRDFLEVGVQRAIQRARRRAEVSAATSSRWVRDVNLRELAARTAWPDSRWQLLERCLSVYRTSIRERVKMKVARDHDWGSRAQGLMGTLQRARAVAEGVRGRRELGEFPSWMDRLAPRTDPQRAHAGSSIWSERHQAVPPSPEWLADAGFPNEVVAVVRDDPQLRDELGRRLATLWVHRVASEGNYHLPPERTLGGLKSWLSDELALRLPVGESAASPRLIEPLCWRRLATALTGANPPYRGDRDWWVDWLSMRLAQKKGPSGTTLGLQLDDRRFPSGSRGKEDLSLKTSVWWREESGEEADYLVRVEHFGDRTRKRVVGYAFGDATDEPSMEAEAPADDTDTSLPALFARAGPEEERYGESGARISQWLWRWDATTRAPTVLRTAHRNPTAEAEENAQLGLFRGEG